MDSNNARGLFALCTAVALTVLAILSLAGGSGTCKNAEGDGICSSYNPTTPKSASAYSTQTSNLTGKYLLAFHACDTATTACSDPRNHKTYIAQSDNGISWQPIPNYMPHNGSVPDIIRRGNTLYIYNPGTLRRYNIDTDTWEVPIPVNINQSNGAPEMFVDPSTILEEGGRIVLFYLVGQTGGDPARCLANQTSCTKIFRSATEVNGSDGAAFIVDSGSRAEINITSSDTASDPDIFNSSAGYMLYISRGNSVQALSSSNLRGSYSNIAGLTDGILVNGSGGIPSGYYDANTSQYWTYVHRPQGNVAVIRLAQHASISSPVQESKFSTILTGSNFSGLGSSYTVESPGFTVNTPGPTSTPTPTTLTANISISGFSFQPQTVNVSAGTTVTWTNMDATAHTVTSNTGLFDSGPLSQGQTFSRTFSDAGSYDYFCSFHPFMTGRVVVTAPTGAPALVFAITPNSRNAQVGTPVTIFMSVINGGTATATGVSITQASSLPATISYQQWNGTAFIGSANTPVDIVAGGTANFVLTINATSAFNSSSMTFNVSSTNGATAPISGVNTLTISASSVPSADIIMMATGTLDYRTGVGNSTAFAVATSNVGTATATGVSFNIVVPSSITGLVTQVNETYPTNSTIKGPATGLTIAVGATPTFAVFLTPTQPIAYDPANNRITLQLVDGSGKVIGAQSVAVSTT